MIGKSSRELSYYDNIVSLTTRFVAITETQS